MALDITTIVVMAAIGALLMMGLLLAARSADNPIPGLYAWVCAYALLTAGFFLNALQGVLPPWLGLITGGTLIIGGMGLWLIGVQRFLVVPLRFEPYVAGACVLTVAVGVALTYVWPQHSLRFPLLGLTVAAIQLTGAWLLLRRAPVELRFPARVTAGAAACVAVLALVRSAATPLLEPQAEIPGSQTTLVVLFLASAVAQLVIGGGCFLLAMMRRTLEITALATLDPLTGALNRRGMEDFSRRLVHDMRRHGTHFTVVLIDIDHFKKVNDTHGHPAGDEVLKRLVAVCLRGLRADSCVARYGGEEFCLLLPACLAHNAHAVAERIRVAFAAESYEAAGQRFACTISMGIADSTADTSGLTGLIKLADVALYRAKKAGRNRIEIDTTGVASGMGASGEFENPAA
jgi:diguanylate cyclase (GGDEF)-like protein